MGFMVSSLLNIILKLNRSPTVIMAGWELVKNRCCRSDISQQRLEKNHVMSEQQKTNKQTNNINVSKRFENRRRIPNTEIRVNENPTSNCCIQRVSVLHCQTV